MSDREEKWNHIDLYNNFYISTVGSDWFRLPGCLSLQVTACWWSNAMLFKDGEVQPADYVAFTYRSELSVHCVRPAQRLTHFTKFGLSVMHVWNNTRKILLIYCFGKEFCNFFALSMIQRRQRFKDCHLGCFFFFFIFFFILMFYYIQRSLISELTSCVQISTALSYIFCLTISLEYF